MKIKAFLIFLLCSLCCVSGLAEAIKLSPQLSIQPVDGDATFQQLPDVGPGNYFCLWNGEALQAFLLTTHEITALDYRGFLLATEGAMKKEGVTNLRIVEGIRIPTASGGAAQRLDMSYKAEGQDTRQIYYIIKSPTGYHSVIVTLTDPSAYDTVASRVDKLMATVSLSSSGAISPPVGWEILSQASEGPALLTATHENSGGMSILYESKDIFDKDDVAAVIDTKVQLLKDKFGIEGQTAVVDEKIDGAGGKSTTFKTTIPDSSGVKIHMRYKIVCVGKGGHYYTIMLSCRVGDERKYASVFSNYLANFKL